MVALLACHAVVACGATRRRLELKRKAAGGSSAGRIIFFGLGKGCRGGAFVRVYTSVCAEDTPYIKDHYLRGIKRFY
jgi:hypothetical protein